MRCFRMVLVGLTLLGSFIFNSHFLFADFYRDPTTGEYRLQPTIPVPAASGCVDGECLTPEEQAFVDGLSIQTSYMALPLRMPLPKDEGDADRDIPQLKEEDLFLIEEKERNSFPWLSRPFLGKSDSPDDDLLDFTKGRKPLTEKSQKRGQVLRPVPFFVSNFADELDTELMAMGAENMPMMINQLERRAHEELKIQAADVVVLDAVHFTRQLRFIHRMLNLPKRLHPWLRWMLYLNRVSPEMLQFYQAALEGRDRIYRLAAESNGKLKIRYQGRIMDIPIYVWPDEAEGAYELVMVQNQRVSDNSSVPALPAGPVPPPQ